MAAVTVNILQAIASVYVLCIGLVALNRMSYHTAHAIRLAYLTLTAGALAALASTLGASNKFECAFAVGAALYLAADRRRQRKART